jgi:excisionase family DNA binding protein
MGACETSIGQGHEKSCSLREFASGRTWERTMKLVETLRSMAGALKVADIAKLLGVTSQHIYKMAASGRIPAFRVSGVGPF